MPPKYRKETNIFFKPHNNSYASIKGEMSIDVQVRWHGKTVWENIGKEIIFDIDEERALKWNNTTNPPIQAASKNFMELRNDI